jgi:hypothetical protein
VGLPHHHSLNWQHHFFLLSRCGAEAGEPVVSPLAAEAHSLQTERSRGPHEKNESSINGMVSVASRRTRMIYATTSSMKTKSMEIERRLETILRSLKKAMQVVKAPPSPLKTTPV